MNSSYTLEKLITDFTNLGVDKSDILFIHSSFKSLGKVEGGAATVISALEAVIGIDGLILMPSFNLLPSREERADAWDMDNTPSTVGWLTEYFRQMDKTYRSDHYSHSVAARGKDAKVFVADHLSREGYQSPWDYSPWGRTYGTHSPMFRAYKRDGKLLMLGVDYNSSTYIHLVEVIHWNKRLKHKLRANYIGLNRPKLGEYWDSLGNLQQGKIGDSQSRLFSIKEYVDTLLAEVERNPEPYVT